MASCRLESTATMEMSLEQLDVRRPARYLPTMSASEGLLTTPRYARRFVETEGWMDTTLVTMEMCTQGTDVVTFVRLSRGSHVRFLEELEQ